MACPWTTWQPNSIFGFRGAFFLQKSIRKFKSSSRFGPHRVPQGGASRSQMAVKKLQNGQKFSFRGSATVLPAAAMPCSSGPCADTYDACGRRRRRFIGCRLDREARGRVPVLAASPCRAGSAGAFRLGVLLNTICSKHAAKCNPAQTPKTTAMHQNRTLLNTELVVKAK